LHGSWKFYRLRAQKVCHKYNFANPIDGTHTQHVESYNNRLKLKIKKMKGLTDMQRERFFKDFMFRERHLNDRFGSFIKLFSCYFIFLRSGCETDLIRNFLHLDMKLPSNCKSIYLTFLSNKIIPPGYCSVNE
jgi:hypothetical protein